MIDAMIHNHSTNLPALVSIAGLILCVFWLYREVCLDMFRERMFTLRDQLFDEARTGLVDFNDPAYGQLRSTMNGFIRFAHKLSLLQMLILLIWTGGKVQSDSPSFAERFVRNVSELKPEQRQRLELYLMRMNYYALLYVVLGSPFAAVTLVMPLVVWLLISRFLAAALSAARVPLEEVDSAALSYGELA